MCIAAADPDRLFQMAVICVFSSSFNLHVLNVGSHDSDDLVYLRLLLRHLPRSLDLSHLLRPRDWLPVWAQRALSWLLGHLDLGLRRTNV